MVSHIEKIVSPLIPRSLPAFYSDEAPGLSDFIVSYYEWLEHQNRFRLTSPIISGSFTVGSKVIQLEQPGLEYIILGFSEDVVDLLGDKDGVDTSQTFYQIDSILPLSGTVSTIAETLVLEGVGTRFLAELSAGCWVRLQDKLVQVDVAISDTQAYLVAGSLETVSGVSASVYILSTTISDYEVEDSFSPIAAERSLLEWGDVDTTLPSLLTRFKSEILSGFPDDMAANERFVIKHILDLYRVKGTSRAARLLFRMIYDEDIEVFEPWRWIFSPSAAEWYIPRYLEVSSSPYFSQLSGTIIRGAQFGATARVEESYIRDASGRNANILTISSVRGRFHRGEYILVDAIPEMTADFAPRVVGSLSAISVVDGGSGYAVGDTLNVYGKGIDARARVAAIRTQSGSLNYTLVDGGSGYTLAANVSITGPGSGASFVVGSIKNKQIITINEDLISDYLGQQLDVYANGFVVGFSSNSGAFTPGEQIVFGAGESVRSLDVLPITGSLIRGENVTWSGGSGVVAITDDTMVRLRSVSGSFTSGMLITGTTSSAVVQLNSVFGTRWNEANGYLVSVNSTHMVISNVSMISSDGWIINNVSVGAGGSNYSNNDFVTFTGVGTGGFATVETDDNGEILHVGVRDWGSGYESAPTAVINTSSGSGASLTPVVHLAGGYYHVNTVVTGSSSGSTATVANTSRMTDWGFPKFASGADNLDSVLFDSMTWDDLEIGTIASLTRKLGGSGWTSNATIQVTEDEVAIRSIADGAGGILGNNAIVTGTGGTALGVISALEVVDSGIAYEPGELLELESDQELIALGRSVIDLDGVGAGFWKNRKSMLSAEMRLQDSRYWQRFSYDIMAPRMLVEYEDVVRRLIHPAGFALFGSILFKDYKETETILESSSLELT